MSKETGGQAYPTQHQTHTTPGMTLRDWFAGQALQGIIAHQEGVGNEFDTAKYCYERADAMILERNKS